MDKSYLYFEKKLDILEREFVIFLEMSRFKKQQISKLWNCFFDTYEDAMYLIRVLLKNMDIKNFYPREFILTAQEKKMVSDYKIWFEMIEYIIKCDQLEKCEEEEFLPILKAKFLPEFKYLKKHSETDNVEQKKITLTTDEFFGLPKETYKKFQNCFATFSEIKQVYIFGSRATMNYRNGSDVDFIVESSKNINQSQCKKYKEALLNLDTPYRFDVVDIKSNTHSELVKKSLNQKSKLFYIKQG